MGATGHPAGHLLALRDERNDHPDRSQLARRSRSAHRRINRNRQEMDHGHDTAPQPGSIGNPSPAVFIYDPLDRDDATGRLSMTLMPNVQCKTPFSVSPATRNYARALVWSSARLHLFSQAVSHGVGLIQPECIPSSPPSGIKPRAVTLRREL